MLKYLWNRRLAAILLLGFSSGLPLNLTGSTLQAWMKTENVDLTLIGIFSLVGLPYALKFLWSPLMDRYVPPFLGRRRGWMLVCQAALVIAIVIQAFSSPAKFPVAAATIAFVVAFFSASQDIVIDAYRTDVLDPHEMGPGASLNILGYRIANLVSGAIALALAQYLAWKLVYLAMAATMAVGAVTSFLAPEPKVQVQPPKTLKAAVVEPFFEFLKRPGALEILAFIIFYKVDTVIANALVTPFLLDLGFEKITIGAVYKGVGFVATLVGAVAGGALMVRLGMKRSLWVFGLTQGISGLSFAMLAHMGHSYPMLVTAVAVENICSAMGTAAFAAFMMSICDHRFTATQYALLTSLMALTRIIGGAPTGFMAKALGWQTYFIVSVFAMIPGLLLLTRYDRWKRVEAGKV